MAIQRWGEVVQDALLKAHINTPFYRWLIEENNSVQRGSVDMSKQHDVCGVDAYRYLVVIEYQHPFPIEFVSYMDSKFVFKKSKIKITATLEGV